MIFEPLYSPDLGLVGFRCRCGACTRVVRTQRGAEMHCWRKHKVKVQMKMTYGETKSSTKSEPLRVEHHEEQGLFYDEHEGEFRGPNGKCPHCGKTDCRCNVDVL